MPTVLVTGANRGLGLEFIKQYAAEGWDVIGTCRSLAAADAAREVAESDSRITLRELEVTDSVAVQALAEELRGTPIDVLILNAGVMGEASMNLGKLDPEDFLKVLNVNVVALAMGLQSFVEHVAASDRKIIVGMGSFLGSMTNNGDGGLYSYRASKAGVSAVMTSAAVDLRDRGITAITMHPGWVQTDMGGPDATISTEESIRGMRKVIDGLGPEDSGRFLTYSGEEMPW